MTLSSFTKHIIWFSETNVWSLNSKYYFDCFSPMKKLTWRGVFLRFHVNDQVRMIPAYSPCPQTPLILTLFGILVHNAFVVWLAEFSHISTKLKLIGTIPGFGLIKILRGREGSWLGGTLMNQALCVALILCVQQPYEIGIVLPILWRG